MDRPLPFSSDLHAAYAHQRAAFRDDPYPAWPVRRDRLQRLLSLLREHQQALCAAIADDFGQRARAETEVLDLVPSLAALRHALRHGQRWMRARRASPGIWFRPASARVLPQPLGVVGIISPWNYPLYLAVGPLASALAAGNRAMLKVSEYTPAFGRLFAQLVHERFSADELVVFTGGAEQAAAFSALALDHLLFTGSTAVGHRVMAAAAANLVPVTLELGGKSPAVVAPDFDLELAARRIVYGKLVNAGQTCVAPDHVYVPRQRQREFAEACARAARELYPAGLGSADYCSIIDTRQYMRLQGMLEQARDAGAEVLPLFAGEQSQPERHRMAPVLLMDPAQSLRAMREEIFGPLLPVLGYDQPEQVLKRINEQPRPLALYWFDDDARRIEHVLRNTHSGGVTLNDTLMHVAQDELPFGGVGPSGMGHYHGRWGFDTFSKLKPVLRQRRLAGTALVRPPYGAVFARLIAIMKRWA